jgi:coenzyme Q-binding protein COQ10
MIHEISAIRCVAGMAYWRQEMPVFQSTRRVRHSADEMFDLVADMERYPEFVPLCARNVIRSREVHGASEVVTTQMTVAYAVFRETFRNRITLDRASRRILVESTDGPLRRLDIEWSFRPQAGDSCEVSFRLNYELASRTLALLMGSVFDAAFSRLAEAFERRADTVYRDRRSSLSAQWPRTDQLAERIGTMPAQLS